MSRYFNYFIFFGLLIVFILFHINDKISSNLLSILPSSQNKELLETFLKVESNKKLFLAVKGDSKESLEKLRAIEQKLLKIKGLQKEQFSQNKKFLEYQKKISALFT